jgi:hypothetical protein
MPPKNRFRHQQYTADPPQAPYHLLKAPAPVDLESDESHGRMRRAGDRLRQAGVAAIYLVHGTFAGNDAFGLYAELERILPSWGGTLRNIGKLIFDKVAQDTGNYTPQFAQWLEKGIGLFGDDQAFDSSDAPAENAPAEKTDLSSLPDVRLHHWSSQNHHLGRADGAIRLIDKLASLDLPAGSRVLLWGHSHAGNVFALITNLLAGDTNTRQAFFLAMRGYYRARLLKWNEVPAWQRVRDLLRQEGNPLAHLRLDFVTFGTPIRYGWDTAGYDRLLHVVNHCPVDELPEYRAPFPVSKNDLMSAAHGDCIQQLAIAGTNLPPPVLMWRAFATDRKLGGLLEPGFRRRDLLKRLAAGRRVPDEGTTLLIDYGPAKGTVASHLAGHAVYTREEHLLFHLEEVVARLYGSEDEPKPI